jgi:adenylate cyclase
MAGVIGDKRFAYDLWGDTVNVASRMESSAEPGSIQVSAETHRQLSKDYVLEPRGEVEIKGLGPTAIWYLVGRKS